MSRLDTLLDAMRPLLEEQGAHAAWLFGSQARGTAHAESDIDLIVVQPSDEPGPLRRLAYAEAIEQAGGAVDLLVYTPEEFEAMRSAGRPFLVDALLEARPVHLETPWAELVERAPELRELRDSGRSLDVHYVEARYPNGQAEGIPSTTYGRDTAEEAIGAAARFVAAASARLHADADS